MDPLTENGPRVDARREREELLGQLEEWLDLPMVVLAVIWLALLVVELVRGLSPLLEAVGTAIWIVFALEFLLRFALAPRKLRFVAKSWLTLLALLVPALRITRIARFATVFRATRAARGLRLFRTVSALNRGVRSLRTSFGRYGFGYVVAATALVTVGGAAGMFAFESETPDGAGLHDFGTALWWTAMIMTTMGTDYWPRTPEGRILCFLLALYAFAVFGYVTAVLASFLVGREARAPAADPAGGAAMQRLADEVEALRRAVGALSARRFPEDA